MTNDDPMYVKHLERGLDAAEEEIKALENEIAEQRSQIVDLLEQLNPTHMGEIVIHKNIVRDDDAARWRWITRAGRTRELRIPADENKASIDNAIDGQRFKQAQRDAEEGEGIKRAMGSAALVEQGEKK